MRRRASRGFSAIEMLVVVAITGVLGALAFPAFMTSLSGYRLNAATSSISGAIQATRFQAIAQGYKYQLVLTSSNLSYQVSKMVPPATTYTNVGSAIPIARTGDVTLVGGTSFTWVFLGNGTVQGAGGGAIPTLQISNGSVTRTITMSGVGNVTVQ